MCEKTGHRLSQGDTAIAHDGVSACDKDRRACSIRTYSARDALV